jgi:hypothetical protein
MGAPAPSPADKDIIEALAEVEKFVFNVENKVLHPAMHGFEDATDGVRLARAGSALNDGADKKRIHPADAGVADVSRSRKLLRRLDRDLGLIEARPVLAGTSTSG